MFEIKSLKERQLSELSADFLIFFLIFKQFYCKTRILPHNFYLIFHFKKAMFNRRESKSFKEKTLVGPCCSHKSNNTSSKNDENKNNFLTDSTNHIKNVFKIRSKNFVQVQRRIAR